MRFVGVFIDDRCTSWNRSSVREKSARITSAIAIVGRLGVGVVGDHTVVSTLSYLVCGDYWANVLHALAHGWHAWHMFLRKIGHPFLSRAHDFFVFFSLVIRSKLCSCHCNKSLALLCSCRRICRRQNKLSLCFLFLRKRYATYLRSYLSCFMLN